MLVYYTLICRQCFPMNCFVAPKNTVKSERVLSMSVDSKQITYFATFNWVNWINLQIPWNSLELTLLFVAFIRNWCDGKVYKQFCGFLRIWYRILIFTYKLFLPSLFMLRAPLYYLRFLSTDASNDCNFDLKPNDSISVISLFSHTYQIMWFFLYMRALQIHFNWYRLNKCLVWSLSDRRFAIRFFDLLKSEWHPDCRAVKMFLSMFLSMCAICYEIVSRKYFLWYFKLCAEMNVLFAIQWIPRNASHNSSWQLLLTNKHKFNEKYI